MPVQPLYVTETSKLRQIALLCHQRQRGFRWTRHALASLVDGYTAADFERMLTSCQVTLVETSQRDITWRAEGFGIDGEALVAVVAASEEEIVIKIITTWVK